MNQSALLLLLLIGLLVFIETTNSWDLNLFRRRRQWKRWTEWNQGRTEKLEELDEILVANDEN
uniref:Uncharacterized protein n=1 Tax=Ciona intestinalis TaxID=7719 RepID=F6VRC8_CIOIN